MNGGEPAGIDEGGTFTEKTVEDDVRCVSDVDIREYGPPSVAAVKMEEDNDCLNKDVSEEIDKNF